MIFSTDAEDLKGMPTQNVSSVSKDESSTVDRIRAAMSGDSNETTKPAKESASTESKEPPKKEGIKMIKLDPPPAPLPPELKGKG